MICAIFGRLLQLALLLLLLLASGMYYLETIGPGIQFQRPDVSPIPDISCVPTTDSMAGLWVDPNLTPEQAAEHVHHHGMGYMSNVLQPETAKALRDLVLNENDSLMQTYVIHAEHRYHVMPDVQNAVVKSAFVEIGGHKTFRPLIDELLGPHSTLVSFSVITNLAGSIDQFWHKDVSLGFMKYPYDFVEEYTLAIPLQDTTPEMGATGFCPGTRGCDMPDVDWDEWESYYENHPEFWEQYDTFDEFSEYNFPCEVVAAAKAGDGILYSAETMHRGRAHTDPDSPMRSVAFFTFAASPRTQDETRTLPLGTAHVIRWDLWGHTVDDMSRIETHPWRIWHAVGLGNSSKNNEHGVRPWTLQDSFMIIFRDYGEIARNFGENVHYDSFEAVSKIVVFAALAGSIAHLLWMLIVFPLWKCFHRRKANGGPSVESVVGSTRVKEE